MATDEELQTVAERAIKAAIRALNRTSVGYHITEPQSKDRCMLLAAALIEYEARVEAANINRSLRS